MEKFDAQNREIAQFTAGVPYIGRDKCFIVVGDMQSEQQYEAAPLTHAYGYYAIEGGNVALNNFEAMRSHFPVRFRAGVSRPTSNLGAYSNWDLVDVVLAWDCPPQILHFVAEHCRLAAALGKLKIYKAAAPRQVGGADGAKPTTLGVD